MDAVSQEAVVLFPNGFQPKNLIEKGSIVHIPDSKNYTLFAKPPLGESIILAFLTKYAINTYENGKGTSEEYFKILSTESLREIIEEKNQNSENFGSGVIFVEIYE